MVPLITVSHIAMTASSFLIVAASLERYIVTVHPRYAKAVHRHRATIAAASVALGVLSKFTMALEFHVSFCLSSRHALLLAVSTVRSGRIETSWGAECTRGELVLQGHRKRVFVKMLWRKFGAIGVRSAGGSLVECRKGRLRSAERNLNLNSRDEREFLRLLRWKLITKLPGEAPLGMAAHVGKDEMLADLRQRGVQGDHV